MIIECAATAQIAGITAAVLNLTYETVNKSSFPHIVITTLSYFLDLTNKFVSQVRIF